MKIKSIKSLILTILFLLGFLYFYYGSVNTFTGIVTWKEVKNIYSQSKNKKYNQDVYFIYIKGNDNKVHTFKVKNNLAHFQFKSYNIYELVQPWYEVEVKSYWIDSPFFSKYRNIFKLKILKKSQNVIYLKKDKKKDLYHNNILKNKDY